MADSLKSLGGSPDSRLSSFTDLPESHSRQITSLPVFKNAGESERIFGKKKGNAGGKVGAFKPSSRMGPTLSEEAKDLRRLFRERFQIENNQQDAFRRIQAAEVSDYLRLAREARVGCAAKYNAQNSLAQLDKMERQIMLDSLAAHECHLKTELLNDIIDTRNKLNVICKLDDNLFKNEREIFTMDYSALCFESSLVGMPNTESDSNLASNYDAVVAEGINAEMRWQLEVQRWECTKKKPEFF
ncbi:unnamed protein product [Phytomonas sp. Hart1]|nr:unnamed protein product [Phytomonas sp. Hart1]|eukprot:CCW67033.1 unnamed protein product [Phytomonas sp. isolate Hart1]